MILKNTTIKKSLTDKQKHFSIVTKYFEGYKYGFLIKNARKFKKSIPYPGKLRFFEVDNSCLSY